MGALALAALAGCCLLSAGMAQNALVDLPADRVAKPGRPLPRGDVRPGTLAVTSLLATLAALTIAASIGTAVLIVAAAVSTTSLAYHAGLKRARLPGCLLLGSARGLDLALGAVAFAAAGDPLGSAPPETLVAALAYAAYMTGASLHASTDDEHGSEAWSHAGLGLACAVLVALLAVGVARAIGGDLAPAAGAVVALWACARLARGWLRLPPPALSGVALSNLHLFDAGLCLVAAPATLAAPAAVTVLALFWLSRRLLTVFPPT
jgi:4-hydroxybenzoate polyprenyltransferase